ncbi:MAG: tol-pal system YbgF family protein, partial [bacterium]
KLMPSQVETKFMNNIGLLFHKVMVTRELKYVMEYYVEKNDTADNNEESMHWHLKRIDALFDDGIDILTSMILENHDNILLLTLFLEDTANAKRHFGENFRKIIQNFTGQKGLAEVYYKVGTYYMECGWNQKAKKMFKTALKENPAHKRSMARLRSLS